MDSALLYIDSAPLSPEIAVRCARLIGFHSTRSAGTLAAGGHLIRRLQPRILIMGLDLPDADTFECLEGLRASAPLGPIVVTCDRCDAALVHNVHRTCIPGVVVNSPRLIEDLAAACTSLLAGKTWYSSSFKALEAQLMADSNAFFRLLTGREFELLREFALGETDDAIAGRKNLASATVQGFRKQVLRKLSLHSSRELMIWALEAGIVRRRDFLLRRRLTL